MRTQVVATESAFQHLSWRGVSRETLLRKNISRQRLKWSHWGKADTEQAVRHPIYEYAT